MLELEDKAKQLINDFKSNTGLNEEDLFRFCNNSKLVLRVLLEYLEKDLISFESYDELTKIITYRIPGRFKVSSGMILEVFIDDNIVKTKLIG